MQPKKNSKANLERRRGIHVQIGLLVALSLVLISLEWAAPRSSGNFAMVAPLLMAPEPEMVQLIERKEEVKPQENKLTILVPADPEDLDPNEIFDDITIGSEYTGGGIKIPEDIDLPPDKPVKPVPRDLVEVPAEFPGGDEAMMRWIYNNIRYPELCAELGIEGKVIAKFTISKFGKVTNIEIARSVHPDLDAEVVRVLKLMPDFRPAMQNQQLVPVFMYWPVVFQLK